MKQETMTPSPKHLEMLSEISTHSKTYLGKEYAFIYTSEALAAMQILQNRIDELEKENERLKRPVLIQGEPLRCNHQWETIEPGYTGETSRCKKCGLEE